MNQGKETGGARGKPKEGTQKKLTLAFTAKESCITETISTFFSSFLSFFLLFIFWLES